MTELSDKLIGQIEAMHYNVNTFLDGVTGYEVDSIRHSAKYRFEDAVEALRKDQDHITYSGDVKNLIWKVREVINLVHGATYEHETNLPLAKAAIDINIRLYSFLYEFYELYDRLLAKDHGTRPSGLTGVTLDTLSKKTRKHLKDQRDLFYYRLSFKNNVKDASRKHSEFSIYYAIRWEFDSMTRLFDFAALPDKVRDDLNSLIDGFYAIPTNIGTKEYRAALKELVSTYYEPVVEPYLRRKAGQYQKAYDKVVELIDRYTR